MTSVKEKKYGVISQLRSMLTNNPERPKFVLNAYLEDSKGRLVDFDRFDIYAHDPVSKIKEKVNKLQSKGGITTLMISDIKNSNEKEYVVYLKI